MCSGSDIPTIRISTPRPRAAALSALVWERPVVGSQRAATRVSPGTASRNSSSHLPAKLGRSTNSPVKFPPGRLKLRTNPL